MTTRDVFDNLSPVDYRYWDEDVAGYLSENAFTRCKLQVEVALVKALHQHGLCSQEVVDEIVAACKDVTTQEVYEEEERTRHDIRALVNCIRKRVSDAAKPFVHMTATSYDIIDTANAMRYSDVVEEVLVPSLMKLMKVLINLTIQEADTVQIGRTHGQHAVPITFGFALASYISRLGNSVSSLDDLSMKLCGKFSGAVGAYNASALFFDDPEAFEALVMLNVGMDAAEHSTQIVPPEPLARLLSEVTLTAGILANLADDMRHLQRTEIAEVGEQFEAGQVGSSTMPQKRNPINFENAKSVWKIIAGRMTTVFLDQISEHQRDLTNSASARTYGEVFAYAVSMTKRLTKTMAKLVVDSESLERNLEKQGGLILAEPLYIILASLGHPDAHEKVKQLTLEAQACKVPFQQLLRSDVDLAPYLQRMTAKQRAILDNPLLYTGIAAKKARAVAEHWKIQPEV